MEAQVIVLSRGKEKKHSWVYASLDPKIPGLYLPKEVVGVDPPWRIKMTLEEQA